MPAANRSPAFSLIELSIVLVILGLLVGGILAGQSLIRASELKAVIRESARFQTAARAFQDKYLAIPGDMANATSFWGEQATGTDSCPSTVFDGTPGTCNGNGNGAILNGGNEMFRFWQHLALSGLLEGTFTGYRGPAGSAHVVPGTNAPLSALSGTIGWHIYNPATTTSGSLNFFDAPLYSNMLVLGSGLTTNSYNWGPALRPEEAWQIDTKLDDGKPARGKVIIRYWDTCSTALTSADNNADYDLTVNTIECNLILVHFI